MDKVKRIGIIGISEKLLLYVNYRGSIYSQESIDQLRTENTALKAQWDEAAELFKRSFPLLKTEQWETFDKGRIIRLYRKDVNDFLAKLKEKNDEDN